MTAGQNPNTLNWLTNAPMVDKNGKVSYAAIKWMQKIEISVSKSLTLLGVNPNAPIQGSTNTVGAVNTNVGTLNNKTQNLSTGGMLPTNALTGSVGGSQVGFNLDSVPDGATRFCTVNGAALNGVLSVDPNKLALIDFSQSGHIKKILDNINDGVTYQRFTRVAALAQTALSTALIGAGGNFVTTVASASVLATDTILWSYSGAPAAQYLNGSINVFVYVTAGNINIVQVNPTAGNVTPGATTVNWQVIR
jgi:hypothetical protein